MGYFKRFMVFLLLVAGAASVMKQERHRREMDIFNHHTGDFEAYLSDIRGGHGETNQVSMDPCPTACQYDYRPVCGSDGTTYNNKCELALTACREKRRMYVEKEGPCQQ